MYFCLCVLTEKKLVPIVICSFNRSPPGCKLREEELFCMKMMQQIPQKEQVKKDGKILHG